MFFWLRQILNILLYSFLTAVIFIGLQSPVYSAGEFETNYEVNYSISSTGITIVTQKVTLKNKMTNLYPKEYSILLDTLAVKNIVAYDDGGIIKPEINQNDNKTNIRLIFNSRIIGIGKNKSFTLRYENTEIAQKIGSIWEINIPGVLETEDLNSYTVSLEVPPSFGENAYMTPPPDINGKWEKAQMTAGGISAAYGKYQKFSLSLVYDLENNKSGKVTTEIAIPPDTAHQKIILQTLKPEPLYMTKDTDGNWMARYEMGPKSILKVEADILAYIFLNPIEGFVTEPFDETEYLKPTRYWNANHPIILAESSKLSGARNIYDYVVNKLNYDYERIKINSERKGSIEALATPDESVCMEYTDLFIALSRAAGIPSRQNVGFAYTTNLQLRPSFYMTDILHAWPEYYNRETGQWTAIDPTWADTTGGVNYFDKLDFNHIVFAINGFRDDYPLPAGIYRRESSNKRQVVAEFSDLDIKLPNSHQFNSQIKFPNNIISGLSTHGNLIIENRSGFAAENMEMEISSVPESVSVKRNFSKIIPYGRLTIPFSLRTNLAEGFRSGKLIYKINGVIYEKSFRVFPFSVIIATFLSLGFLIFISIWKKRSKFVKKIKN